MGEGSCQIPTKALTTNLIRLMSITVCSWRFWR